MFYEVLTKEKLIEKIQYIYETDIGDFKRRVALYLNRFSESQNDLSLKRNIQDLKVGLLYQEISLESQQEAIDDLRFNLLEKLRIL